MTYGVRVPADGQAEVVEMGEDLVGKLDVMQEIIGGYIERIPMLMRGVYSYWCDEEGHIKELPKNDFVSYLAGQVIVGTVLILMRPTADGEVPTMSFETAEAACKAVNDTIRRMEV